MLKANIHAEEDYENNDNHFDYKLLHIKQYAKSLNDLIISEESIFELLTSTRCIMFNIEHFDFICLECD